MTTQISKPLPYSNSQPAGQPEHKTRHKALQVELQVVVLTHRNNQTPIFWFFDCRPIKWVHSILSIWPIQSCENNLLPSHLIIAAFNHDRLAVEFNHNKCDESFSYQVVLDRTVGSAVHYWFHFYWIGESLSRFQFESLLSVTTCINPHQHFIMFYASICKSSHPPIKWKLYEFNGLMSNGSNLVYEAFWFRQKFLWNPSWSCPLTICNKKFCHFTTFSFNTVSKWFNFKCWKIYSWQHWQDTENWSKDEWPQNGNSAVYIEIFVGFKFL